ncbi:hypothetical protein HYDPIDRAFT_172466 [Hydnomerulius pinastri MD-312]|nr:hypothetical protein HYDPIDRAFT_172466 [Hydnomerulius pinastri MD-312]
MMLCFPTEVARKRNGRLENVRRREDRSTSAVHADPYKVWVPTDKHPDYDSDQRRRHRSSTVPVHAHDPRTYPPAHDNRYQETRQSSRTHRQDPSYTSAAPATSYHQSSAPGPSSTSRTLHHATRPSAQYSSSGYQYQQSSSHQPSAPTQPSQGTNLYPGPVASSSRSRAYPEVPDPRLHSHRRPVATPTPKSSYEKVSSAEDGGRASRHPARAIHSSTQPPQPAPVNQSFWVPPAPEMSSSRRHKDRDKDRDREREWERERAEREKERERERTSAELERDRYKERMRAERHRERERATDAERYRDPSKSRHHDRRKESDTEGVMYSEQRNASKASLSGREGYAPSIREPSGGGHKRHWTEDGTAATSARRRQAETTQNPITTVPVHSTSEPQADGLTPQQTGEPPPAPRVMPVYLPPKAKSSRSHRVSVAQGAQSGSDTEWTSGKVVYIRSFISL